MIVLWVMGLVSLAIGALTSRFTHELRLSQVPVDAVQRRAIAQAAVHQAIALIQRDEPSVDHLKDEWATGLDAQTQEPLLQEMPVGRGHFSVGQQTEEGFVVGLIDEERKLNLKTATREHLQRLMEAVGPGAVDPEVLDSILARRAACDTADPPCTMTPFQTVEELLRVCGGMTPELFAALEPYVTVYGTGAVNANTASEIVLDALGCNGADLVSRRRSSPFTTPPADCPGTQVASTAFSVAARATLSAASGITPLRAVVDRQGVILYWSSRHLFD